MAETCHGKRHDFHRRKMNRPSSRSLVFYLSSLACGGAERVAILLARELQTMEYTVNIVTCRLDGEFVSQVPHGVIITDLHCRKPIRGTRKLAATIRTSKPRGVFAFGIYAGIAAAISRTIFRWKPPLVIRNENNLALDWKEGTALNRLIGPPLSRWAARRARMISVSNSLAEPTFCFLKVPPSSITTIVNPVFYCRFDDSHSAVSIHPWLQNSVTPVFVACGRLEHQKGFDTLIDAFAIVKRQCDAKLVIFGEGSLEGSLKARLEYIGLGDSVDLAGYTDHPMVQMRAAHAFVLSSRFEGFGLVLVEALYAGTRVISTNCNYGPAEILENGRYGTLVPVEDTSALAKVMLDSLDDRIWSRRPPEAWFDQFDAKIAAERHLALIDES